MKNIEVKKIVQAIETSDGAGVKLKRSIGTPEADYIDPFLMLDEFGSENKDDYIAGFPPHPHRGIETVTYMLKGEFEHQDSTGAKGIMSSGDVQWMKTGRGIIHSEMPAMSDGKLLGFQLWVNMPAKLKKNKPEYLYIKSNEIGVHEDNEKTVKVIAGKYEKAEGPEKNHNIDLESINIEEDLKINFMGCEKALVSGETFKSYYYNPETKSLIDALKSSSIQTRVITGSEDKITPNTHQVVQDLVSEKNNIRLFQIDGSDHFFRDFYFDDLMEIISTEVEK